MDARGRQARRISGGTTLVREGEPIDAMYLVLDGQLSVTITVSAPCHPRSLRDRGFHDTD
jgi:CRP-like cAMP-binding protein